MASGAGFTLPTMQKQSSQMDIGSLMNMLSMFQGGESTTTTSGSTETKQTQLSQEAVNAMLKSIMEGTQGLAPIAMGQKTAGMYNTTTNQMLINDLLSKAAGQVAIAGAPTTTTKSPTVQTVSTPAKVSAGTAAGGLGALSALSGLKGMFGSSSKEEDAKKKAGIELAKQIELESNPSYFPGASDSTGYDIFGGGKGVDSNPLNVDYTSSEMQAILNPTADFASTAYDIVDTVNMLFAPEAAFDFAAPAGAEVLGGSIIDAMPAFEWGADMWGAELASEAALDFSVPGLGVAAAVLGGGSVICTELHRQGLMSDLIYAADTAYGLEQSKETIIGYQAWGIPFASLMKKSPLFTKIVNFFAAPWSREMAYQMGAVEKGSLFGKVLTAVFKPMCTFIGKIILAKKELSYVS